MQAFKTLWQPKGNISIPKYDISDGVDLQVKALLYMFKRLGIARAGDKLEPHPIPELSEEDLVNLDRMYNLEGFKSVVFNDAHRVLVDWPKNRFRAMLLLAHFPQMDELPNFGERNFRFTVLEADASKDEYVLTLSRSDIYIEHNLPLEIRSEIATNVVNKLNPTTLESRQAAILEYLHTVSTEIQIARIYKAMISKLSPSHSPSQSPFSSPPRSPMQSPAQPAPRSRSPSPQRQPASPQQRPSSPIRGGFSRFPKVSSEAPKLSASQPRLASPQQSQQQQQQQQQPRLRMRPSQSNLKLADPPNLNNSNAPKIADGSITHIMDAARKHVLQQARLAVRARIEREQKVLNRGS